MKWCWHNHKRSSHTHRGCSSCDNWCEGQHIKAHWQRMRCHSHKASSRHPSARRDAICQHVSALHTRVVNPQKFFLKALHGGSRLRPGQAGKPGGGNHPSGSTQWQVAERQVRGSGILSAGNSSASHSWQTTVWHRVTAPALVALLRCSWSHKVSPSWHLRESQCMLQAY